MFAQQSSDRVAPDRAKKTPARRRAILNSLSDELINRQQEVMRGLCEGFSNH